MNAIKIRVDLGDERSYPIYIGEGLLSAADTFRLHVTSKKALVVTNVLVGPLYAEIVRRSLEQCGVEVFVLELPDGEEHKCMEGVMRIVDAAMDAKLDRKSMMVALGGGVVGDMCGFAAAIYQRGIRFVQIPTTLMAMVDSSVGGKTGVNHPLGKNMIGAFYQPEAVIIDITTLSSLPDRELRSGLAEVVKYGLIRDESFFRWLELNVNAALRRDPEVLMEAVRRSCENKAAVVAADEREGGVRATLNLGHTFGHAIETGLGYGAWLHGEAVAAGMVMAADMSLRMGLVDEEIVTRTREMLQRVGLPVSLDNPHAEADLGRDDYAKRVCALTKSRFLQLMSVDKKVSDGRLSLVLLQGPLGSCVITSEFDDASLGSTLDRYCSN